MPEDREATGSQGQSRVRNRQSPRVFAVALALAVVGVVALFVGVVLSRPHGTTNQNNTTAGSTHRPSTQSVSDATDPLPIPLETGNVTPALPVVGHNSASKGAGAVDAGAGQVDTSLLEPESDTDTDKQLAGGGAMAPAAATDVLLVGANTTDPIAALLGTKPLGDALEGFKAKWFAAAKTCTPGDSAAFLRDMADDSCQVVSLRPGVIYALTARTIEITRTVVIVGNPVNRPLIDGTAAERVFRVRSGGHLELMYTRLYRGRGRLIGGMQQVLAGGGALIDPGGRLHCRGVDFTTPISFEITARSSFLLGGTFMVLGGSISLVNCRFLAILPTGIRFNGVFGGEILVVDGVLFATGCTFVATTLVSVIYGAGGTFMVMAGTTVLTGCTFVRVLGASVGAPLAGAFIFIGGGVGIVTGCTVIVNGVLFNFWGAAFLIFVGGGVVIVTGFQGFFSLCFAANGGVGNTFFVGAGVLHITGFTVFAQAVFQNSIWAGGNIFVGTGYAGVTGGYQGRQNVGYNAIQVGGLLELGSGAADVVGNVLQNAQVMSSIIAQGFTNFVGAGALFIAMSPRVTATYLFFRQGQGISGWVGAGALIAVDTNDAVIGGLGYAVNGTVEFFIGAGLLSVTPPDNDTRMVLDGTASSTHTHTRTLGDSRGHPTGSIGHVQRRKAQLPQASVVLERDTVTANTSAWPHPLLYAGPGVMYCHVCESYGSPPLGASDIQGPNAGVCQVSPSCVAPGSNGSGVIGQNDTRSGVTGQFRHNRTRTRTLAHTDPNADPRLSVGKRRRKGKKQDKKREGEKAAHTRDAHKHAAASSTAGAHGTHTAQTPIPPTATRTLHTGVYSDPHAQRAAAPFTAYISNGRLPSTYLVAAKLQVGCTESADPHTQGDTHVCADPTHIQHALEEHIHAHIARRTRTRTRASRGMPGGGGVEGVGRGGGRGPRRGVGGAGDDGDDVGQESDGINGHGTSNDIDDESYASMSSVFKLLVSRVSGAVDPLVAEYYPQPTDTAGTDVADAAAAGEGQEASDIASALPSAAAAANESPGAWASAATGAEAAPQIPPPADSEGGACSHLSEYQAFFTTTLESEYNAIKAAVSNLSDRPETLRRRLGRALGGVSTVCSLSSATRMAMEVPGLKPSDNQHSTTSYEDPASAAFAASMSQTLGIGLVPHIEVRSASMGEPLTELTAGDAYDIAVEGIPELSLVSLSLLPVDDDDGSSKEAVPEHAQFLGTVAVPRGTSSAVLRWQPSLPPTPPPSSSSPSESSSSSSSSSSPASSSPSPRGSSSSRAMVIQASYGAYTATSDVLYIITPQQQSTRRRTQRVMWAEHEFEQWRHAAAP